MINKYSSINIYEDKKKNSKLSSQILYGEKFSIIKKYKDWYKIKTSYDKYVGFIKKKKFEKFTFKPTHKVSSLKANIFFKPIKNSRIKMKLSFASLLHVKSSNKGFLKFDNNWWLAGGISIDWVENIIKKIKPNGIDISSSIETSPGLKDIPKTKELIDAIKSCEHI